LDAFPWWQSKKAGFIVRGADITIATCSSIVPFLKKVHLLGHQFSNSKSTNDIDKEGLQIKGKTMLLIEFGHLIQYNTIFKA